MKNLAIALLAALSVEHWSQGGVVEGIVRFNGLAPESSIPDDAGVRRTILEVNSETRGLRFVVVSLRALTNNTRPKFKKNPARMDQQDYMFAPRVLAVQAGEPVLFTNSDPANHNVRTTSTNKTNEFNVFTGQDGRYEHKFVAQTRPVRVGCDIHPWMQGWIYVFDHSAFTVTDARGEFSFADLPVGDYKIVFEQPDLRYRHEQNITVTAERPARIEVEARLESKP